MANPTILDVARRMDPDGQIPDVAEVLTKTNPILKEMPWFEGNLPTGNVTVERSSLTVQPARSICWRHPHRRARCAETGTNFGRASPKATGV